jgi:hypothetical protein
MWGKSAMRTEYSHGERDSTNPLKQPKSLPVTYLILDSKVYVNHSNPFRT